MSSSISLEKYMQVYNHTTVWIYKSSIMPKNYPVPFCSQLILLTSALMKIYLFSNS